MALDVSATSLPSKQASLGEPSFEGEECQLAASHFASLSTMEAHCSRRSAANCFATAAVDSAAMQTIALTFLTVRSSSVSSLVFSGPEAGLDTAGLFLAFVLVLGLSSPYFGISGST